MPNGFSTVWIIRCWHSNSLLLFELLVTVKTDERLCQLVWIIMMFFQVDYSVWTSSHILDRRMASHQYEFCDVYSNHHYWIWTSCHNQDRRKALQSVRHPLPMFNQIDFLFEQLVAVGIAERLFVVREVLRCMFRLLVRLNFGCHNQETRTAFYQYEFFDILPNLGNWVWT